ncbi:hypothetical protein NCAS_0B07140 [Naumovozyma castellii]|uniref:Uncharacterized protein n=1 Tax=Naumovozyma castellii TaxID=27288 RepID=G0VA68_NAUCA|nr:hypothetical protein NCAS_0B07140 [Naumovozyma castellii CBS 4309]CCC68798.1 hypothetical protein NCAS_0B07140 [Naumovozyma castellii CBS 4309]
MQPSTQATQKDTSAENKDNDFVFNCLSNISCVIV